MNESQNFLAPPKDGKSQTTHAKLPFLTLYEQPLRSFGTGKIIELGNFTKKNWNQIDLSQQTND